MPWVTVVIEGSGALAYEGVVAAFRRTLPGAVVVYDNGSTDGTAQRARAAGAHVITEHRPGKGAAVRRLFAEVDTDHRERPAGSHGKLSTYGDGLRILRRLLRLYGDFEPSLWFGLPGLVAALAGLAFFVPVLVELTRTDRVAPPARRCPPQMLAWKPELVDDVSGP